MKPLIKATLVAGTLDILSAFLFAGMAGMTPIPLLQFVASGPFGDQAKSGDGWALVGLLVHYAIMAVMVAAYFFAAKRVPAMNRTPILSGAIYGVLVWVVMYWLVRPMRWPAMWPPDGWAKMTSGGMAWSIGNALFSHIVLVGIPIAVIAAKSFKSRKSFA